MTPSIFRLFTLGILLGLHASAGLANAIPEKRTSSASDEIKSSIASIKTEYIDRSTSTGTGLFVNQAGFLLTARHVVFTEGRQLKTIIVSIPVPSAKIPGGGRFTGNSVGGYANIVAMDAAHDLALLLPTLNPFTNDWGAANIGGLDQAVPVSIAYFDPRIARSGEVIFLASFPQGSFDLKTARGKVSAFRLSGPQSGRKSSYYLADFQTNPGSGPVFSEVTRSVLGISDSSLSSSETIAGPARGGSARRPGSAQGFRPATISASSAKTIILPSSYLTEFLRANGIQFSSSSTSGKASSGRKR